MPIPQERAHRRAVSFVLPTALVVSAALIAGCNSGSSSSFNPTPIATATPSPQPAAQSTQALSPAGNALAIPAAGGVTGTVTFSGSNAPSGTTVTMKSNTGATGNGPSPQSARRHIAAASAIFSLDFWFTVPSGGPQTITFTGIPGFQLILPGTEPALTLELFDDTTGKLLASDAPSSVTSSNGSTTETFPVIPTPITFNVSHVFTFEVVAGSTLPSPTASPQPTATPTAQPTATPTAQPTATPTAQPTATPTAQPTATPTAQPTATPTPQPTATPTVKPTASPTPQPTATPKPTASPTPQPTATPKPTASPTPKPTATPQPTATPKPTATPTPQATSASETAAVKNGANNIALPAISGNFPGTLSLTASTPPPGTTLSITDTIGVPSGAPDMSSGTGGSTIFSLQISANQSFNVSGNLFALTVTLPSNIPTGGHSYTLYGCPQAFCSFQTYAIPMTVSGQTLTSSGTSAGGSSVPSGVVLLGEIVQS